MDNFNIETEQQLITFIKANLNLLPLGFFDPRRNRVKGHTMSRKVKDDGSIIATSKVGQSSTINTISPELSHLFWSDVFEIGCTSQTSEYNGSIFAIDEDGNKVGMAGVPSTNGHDNDLLKWKVTHRILIPENVVAFRHKYPNGRELVVKV